MNLSLLAALKSVKTFKTWPLGTFFLMAVNLGVYFFSLDVAFQYNNPTALGLVGHMFSHWDFGHLMGNMFLLNFISTPLEARYGSFKLVLFYLVCGSLATLGYGFYDNFAVVKGASAAVCGLLAIYSLNRRTILEVGLCGFFIGEFFFRQFYSAWNYPESSTAYLAHVAGAVVGLVLAGFYRK